MIIVDDALAARAASDRPINVAMVGAGFMARGIANQIVNSVPGMELAAISNRNVGAAVRAYAEAGVANVQTVGSTAALETAIARGQPAVTDDAMLVCAAGGIDVIVEVTGAVEFGAHVVVEAIRHGKDVVLMNAEVDGTVGPILKAHADRAGVILTASDGAQPGAGLSQDLLDLLQQVGAAGVEVVGLDQALACQASPLRQQLDQSCSGKVVQKERRDHEIDATFSKGQGKHITLDKSDFQPSWHVLPRPPQMRMAPVERIDLQWDGGVTRPSRHDPRDGTASSSQVEDTHMVASTFADPRVEM
jgi:predicted homoserine dehydrogenase-like protein